MVIRDKRRRDDDSRLYSGWKICWKHKSQGHLEIFFESVTFKCAFYAVQLVNNFSEDQMIWEHRMCLLQPQGYPKRDEREFLPYEVDVQADLSLCWLHRPYCRFCLALVHICLPNRHLLAGWLKWLMLSTCKRRVVGWNPARIGKIFRPLVHPTLSRHSLGWVK